MGAAYLLRGAIAEEHEDQEIRNVGKLFNH